MTSMLRSFLKALAGSDINSKSDAYITFSNVIRASDKIPDSHMLLENMSELCRYIERDLIVATNNGKSNLALVSQALTLVNSLQYNPSVAVKFPVKFQIRLVELAVTVLGGQPLCREIVRNIMFVIAHQNFSCEVITPERFVNLMTKLNHIDHSLKGKSIILGRLDIYRNLLKNCKSLMAIHTAWIEDLLCDMNSSLKEIQESAIKFGFEAAIELGAEFSVTESLCALFKSNFREGQLYGTTYSKMLLSKIKSKEQAVNVPKIWSIIILLQRHRKQIIAQTSHMKPLLEVLAFCFNHKDVEVQSQAQFAWNRLIFAVKLSEKTPKSIRDMLIRPYIQSLVHQKSNCIFESLSNLQYYAFRPGCSTAQLDLYWDEFVKVPVFQTLSSEKSKFAIDRNKVRVITQILANLFDVSFSRKWTEKKAVESFEPNVILAQELPVLDTKWLRKNTSRIFSVLLSIFDRLFWDFADSSSMATNVWKNYINSVTSQATMEVKILPETLSCIANILGFLNQRWDSGIANTNSLPYLDKPQNTKEYLQSLQSIISITISGFGFRIFTGTLLHFSQGCYTPIVPPYLHTKKIDFYCKNPVNHLIWIFTQKCPGLEYNSQFSEFVEFILEPLFEVRKNLSSCLSLIMDFYQTLIEAKDTIPLQIIWQILSKYLLKAIDKSDAKFSDLGDHSIYENYSNIVKILQFGIKISPNQPLPEWISMFESISKLVTLQFGHAGKAIATLEPLSESLIQVNFQFPYMHLLILNMEYPNNPQELEIARKKLLSTERSRLKSTSLDPYLYTYKCIKISLTAAYYSSDENYDIIYLVNALLSRCPDKLKLNLLINLKDEISLWISDEKFKLSNESCLLAAKILWTTVNTTLIQELEIAHPKETLLDIKALFFSGLESKNRCIAEMTKEIYNSSFVEFPDNFKSLRNLKSALNSGLIITQSDLSSPTKPRENKNQENRSHCEIIDQQNNDGNSETVNQSSAVRYEQLSLGDRNSQMSTPQVVIEVSKVGNQFHKSRNKQGEIKATKTIISKSHRRKLLTQSESDISANFITQIQNPKISSKRGKSRLKKIKINRLSYPITMENSEEESVERDLRPNQLNPVTKAELSTFELSKNASITDVLSSTASTCDIVERIWQLSSPPGSYQSISKSFPLLKQRELSTSLVTCTNDNLMTPINCGKRVVLGSIPQKVMLSKRSHLEILPDKYNTINDKIRIDSNSVAHTSTIDSDTFTNKEYNVTANNDFESVEYTEAQDTFTPLMLEGKTYNSSPSSERREMLANPKSQEIRHLFNGKILSCFTTRDSEKNIHETIDIEETVPIDHLIEIDTPSLIRLSGVISSPVSLHSSSSHSYSNPEFLSLRAENSSPDFRSSNKSNISISPKKDRDSLNSLKMCKNITKDEELLSSMRSSRIERESSHEISVDNRLTPNFLGRTYQKVRKLVSLPKTYQYQVKSSSRQVPESKNDTNINNCAKYERPSKPPFRKKIEQEGILRLVNKKRKRPAGDIEIYKLANARDNEKKKQSTLKRRKIFEKTKTEKRNCDKSKIQEPVIDNELHEGISFEGSEKGNKVTKTLGQYSQHIEGKIKDTGLDFVMRDFKSCEANSSVLEFNRALTDDDLVSKNPDPNLTNQKPSELKKYISKQVSPDVCESITHKIDLLIFSINEANLSKDDVNKIEDRMMDAKRALYEAEWRGRASR